MKSVNGKSGKMYIGNKNKFVIFVAVILVLILALMLIVNSKKNIDSNTNLSKLNTKKYSKEILVEYEKEGQKEKFSNDYEAIQTAVGMYILNNSTLETNSFSVIYKEITKDLSSGNWKKIGIDKPISWNGTWSINDSGILKFKFEMKDIEPSWIKDIELENKIIKN